MAVSYLSKPTNQIQYLDPIDKSTLTSILVQKQEKFDQGVQAIQNQIDTYQSTVGNLFRESDQKYMQGKINEYVDSVNNQYGTADFSQMSTLNNVSALGSVVFKDERILGSIQDSKAIQGMLESYKKMKTDPKLMPNYNPANEAWDMQFIERYKNNPGERYFGSSTPTPSVDKNKKLDGILGKLKEDIETRIGPDGYITMIKGVGKDRVVNLAKDAINSDPTLKKQIEIEAWYQYKGIPKETLNQAFQAYKNGKTILYDQQIKDLSDKKLLVPAGSKEAQVLDANLGVLKRQRDEINNFNTANIPGYLFENDLIDQTVNKYSYQQEIKKSDPTWIANRNLAFRERQHTDNMNFKFMDFKADQFWKQKEYDLKEKNYDLDVLKFQQKQSEDGTTSQGGIKTGGALYSGQEASVSALTKTDDLNKQIFDLQLSNMKDLSDTFINIIVDNQPELMAEADNIKRIVGASFTSSEAAYDLLKGSSISLKIKDRLNKLDRAMFRQLDASARGAMPVQELRQNSFIQYSGVLDRMNQRFIEANNLQDALSKAEDIVYAKNNISPQLRKQIETDVANMKRNPSSIPQEYLIKAEKDLGIKFAYEGQGPVVRNRAIELYRQDKIGITPSRFREQMDKEIPQEALSRKSFVLTKKQDEEFQRVIVPQIRSLVNVGDREIEPGRFIPQDDGSMVMEYRTFTKDGSKVNYDGSGIQKITIPADQSMTVKQFLPEGWGQRIPYQGYSEMIARKGGLIVDGKTIRLFTQGNFNIPFTLQRATSSQGDTKVKILVQKFDQGGKGTPQWVPATNLGIFNSAADAIMMMQKHADNGYNTGSRNVQEYVYNNILGLNNGR